MVKNNSREDNVKNLSSIRLSKGKGIINPAMDGSKKIKKPCRIGKHRWHLLRTVETSKMPETCIFVCDKCGFMKEAETVKDIILNKRRKLKTDKNGANHLRRLVKSWLKNRYISEEQYKVFKEDIETFIRIENKKREGIKKDG